LQYLFKGNQKVSLNLNNTADVDERDEIKLMQRGRMLCSMQAWWLIWGYQNYPATKPSAKLIKVKLPAMVWDLAHDRKLCDLAMYFARPTDAEELRELTYVAFFNRFDYGRTLPKRVVTGTHAYYEMQMHGKTLYIYRTAGHHIVRMGAVPFGAGEIFWLRLLLQQRPVYSYLELRTVGEFVCSSFKHAAALLNLAKEEAVSTEMFLECLVSCTGTGITKPILFPVSHFSWRASKSFDNFLPSWNDVGSLFAP
jgi:hypothetical protein